MEPKRKVKTATKRERVVMMAGRETHKQIKVLAALDGIRIDEAFDKYAASAVAKVYAEKTASK